MTVCSIKWCGKSSAKSSSKTDGITFHRFPKDIEVRKKWVEASARGGKWSPTHNSVVCSRHFTENCFHIVGLTQVRRINSSAIPTLFLPNEESALPKCHDHSKDGQRELKMETLPEVPANELGSYSLTDILRRSPNLCSENSSKETESRKIDFSPEINISIMEHRLPRIRKYDLTKSLEEKKKLLRQSRDCARRLETKLETLKIEMEELRIQKFGLNSKNSNNKDPFSQYTTLTSTISTGSIKHELNNTSETEEHNTTILSRCDSTERILRRKIRDLMRKLNQAKIVNKTVRSTNTNLRKSVNTLKVLLKKLKTKGLLSQENVSIERLKSSNRALVEKVAMLRQQLIEEKKKNRGVERNMVWCKSVATMEEESYHGGGGDLVED